ncbi:MAG: TspO/MBR family protein [Candidatus Aenigmatarchaeota archaeon]
MKYVKPLKLALSILISLSAGFIGSFFTAQTVDTWYAGLELPRFAPPGYIISVIWIVLYVLMGIALYLVLTKDISERNVQLAIGVFGVQLFLNAIWSYLFFGLTSPLYGLIGIIALWIAVASTIYTFQEVSKKASYLLYPYIIWVTIALILNYLIYVMN